MEKVSLAAIINHKLTRKEFLLYMMGVIIAITGINAILKVLNPKPEHQTSGFGSGPYGGK